MGRCHLRRERELAKQMTPCRGVVGDGQSGIGAGVLCAKAEDAPRFLRLDDHIGTVTGLLYDGTAFQGTDSICVN